MLGVRFIGPGLNSSTDPLVNEITRSPSLPKPYFKESMLSDHLISACFFDALELSAKVHVNLESGEGFGCVSYYTEDQQDGAFSSGEGFGHVSTMSAPFVRRLVKISHLLTPALNLRPRTSSAASPTKTHRMPQNDHDLNALLGGNAQVSETEALSIVSNWPSTNGPAQIELGEYALFYDLIRLIWVHEWAHGLCGHLALAQSNLGISRLHEFSADRVDGHSNDEPYFRRNEVLQGIELHADEFALKHCIHGILWGYDPIASIAGPDIDLMDRVLISNVAFCVYAVVWALAERRYSPDDTFYPPPQDLTSDASSPLFVTTRSSHPPAVLRYDRFRGFQRDLTNQYGLENGRPDFGPMVDAFSFEFLETLGKISGHFRHLQAVTPMMVRTPVQKRLEAYEEHLLRLERLLGRSLEKLCYLPTVDPYATDDDDEESYLSIR